MELRCCGDTSILIMIIKINTVDWEFFISRSTNIFVIIKMLLFILFYYAVSCLLYPNNLQLMWYCCCCPSHVDLSALSVRKFLYFDPWLLAADEPGKLPLVSLNLWSWAVVDSPACQCADNINYWPGASPGIILLNDEFHPGLLFQYK